MLRPASSSTVSRISLAAALAFVAWLVAHRLWLVWNNSVNVLFWDQWDVYMPLFRELGAWDGFNHQHGPHRQGLGSLLTGAMALWTGWDVRYDAMMAVGAMILAAGIGIDIARRCEAGLIETLLLVPLLALTTRQYELWVGPSNPAHSPLPVLLTMTYAWCWFIERPSVRLPLQAVLVALLIFTGFGIFAGAIGSALFAWEAWSHWREERPRAALVALAAIVFAAGVWALFFRGYVFEPAEPNFRFPHSRPWEYLWFIVMMFAAFGGWKDPVELGFPLGAVLFIAVLLVAVTHGRRLLAGPFASKRTSIVLLVLAAATLLFCLNPAVGRIGLGWRAGGNPSRYVAMLMPGLFAVYLASRAWPKTWMRGATFGFLLFIAAWKGLLPSSGDQRSIDGFRRSQETWVQVMLETGSKEAADKASMAVNNYPIYPGDIRDRLIFLRERRLNFYKDAAGAPVQ